MEKGAEVSLGNLQAEVSNVEDLGFFAIIKESWKAFSAQKKVFAQISLALLLPLSICILGYLEVSLKLFIKFIINDDYLEIFYSQYPHNKHHQIHSYFSRWILFVLYNLSFVSILIMFGLLFVGAGVYTAASRYADTPISFKIVMNFTRRIWAKLAVTFLWSYLIVIILSLVAMILVLIGVIYIGLMWSFVWIVYLIGLEYAFMVWGMASVVSVLKEDYGLKSMVKGGRLIRGKMVIAMLFALVVGVFIVGIDLMFVVLVGVGIYLMWLRVVIGVVCALLFMVVVLFVVVFQTVFFFVCKSHHDQRVEYNSNVM